MKFLHRFLVLFAVNLLLIISARSQKTKAIWLDDLTIKSFSEGIPAVLGKTNAGGDSMLINGNYFNRGVGVNGVGILAFFFG